MSHSENKRRNSIERYQPRTRNITNDSSTGDDDDLTSHFTTKLSINDNNHRQRNDDQRQQEENQSRDLPNNHNGGHHSNNRNRRAVNSHLYASRGGGGSRGRGRGGHGRGRGRDYVTQNNDGLKENRNGNDHFNSDNHVNNRTDHRSSPPASSNNKWKNAENDSIRFDNNATHHYNNGSTQTTMMATQQQPRKKNTETFKPRHKPADMRILTAHAGWKKYEREVTPRDVMIVHDLFCEPSDMTIYNKLLDEMKASGVDQQDLWKLWHGDSHVIADDKQKWKDACPTFHMVLHRIRDYFEMDIKGMYKRISFKNNCDYFDKKCTTFYFSEVL